MIIARQRVALLVAAAAVLLSAACQKVPLLAPSGSSITLTSSATTLPVNGTTTIIAQVIEASGTPPHSGTAVTFTTTLGSIQPNPADTDVNGQAVVTFRAGTQSGTATIGAISGGANVGANGAIKIAIGTAAVGRVNVTATPSSVPATGGTTTITAMILDINGNPLVAAPVNFSTTAGNLGAAVVISDSNGLAVTTLTTAQQAIVTASVGAQGSTGGTGSGGGTGGSTGGGTGGGTGTGGGGSTSGQASGTVTVTVLNAPTLLITPPTAPPSAGLPASFTFVVTAAANNGSAVRDVFVEWGDGGTDDLGAFTGSQVIAHTYHSTGTFRVTGTITDAAGNRQAVSTAVTVIPVPRPAIQIQATPGLTGTLSATFTITITAPTGIAIQDVTIFYGDGESQDLGGAPTGTLSNITHKYATPGQKNVQVNVLDSSGQTTTGTVQVTVS